MARKPGMLLEPEIMGSARAVHARELAKEMLMGGFKHGGKVRKTGLYRLHAGETVVPAKKSHRTLDR